MPNLTVEARDLKGVAQSFDVALDRVPPTGLRTPCTVSLEAGNHYVEILIPLTIGWTYPYWAFNKWVDPEGNTIGTTSALSIDLQTDTTVIAVCEYVQPLPSWVVPVLAGLAVGVPSVIVLYYLFKKKK